MKQQTIGDLIDNVIREATDLNRTKNNDIQLAEKEKQVKLAAKNVSQEPDDGTPKSTGDGDHISSDEEKNAEQHASEDQEKEDSDNEVLATVPEVDDIVEKLNSIRSGRSLKDSGVKDRFEGYIADLKDSEKVALFAFLKGISQIITGDLEPTQAVEPQDDPADIRMHKGKKIQQKSQKKVEPNVVKKPSEPVAVKKTSSGVEDTTPPSPITAKKR